MDSGPVFVLRNATLSDGRVADITTRNGYVDHIGASPRTAEGIDCTSLLVLPAAIDMHVHMRGGPQSQSEDWESGSMSALAGGVTVVVDQPNTIPPLDTVERYRNRVKDAQHHSWCGFAINSAVTPDTPFEAMWREGAMAFGETFYAPSSFGNAIGENMELVLDRISAAGALMTVHAEKIDLSVSETDSDLITHSQVRSVRGEIQAIQEVERLNKNRCRLHFCHLSDARSLDAAHGTTEVTPHHLFLAIEDFSNDDAYGKVNPPLRTQKEQKVLWSHWDQIDVVASDHAPHPRQEKMQEFSKAPSGIPGVETMVPLLLARCLEGKITKGSIIQKTVKAPAHILGIPPSGFEAGNRADFALYGKEVERIHAGSLHSRCGFSPFEGKPAVFPKVVIMGGEIVFNRGEFIRQEPVWFSGKGYQPV